jgi:zinc/manganese transport system substrate-binding protein
MNFKKYIVSFLIVIGLSTPAHAKLNVVATLPWIGSLAEEIGKDKVSVKVLVKPSQDPHYVEAKPSMILAARNADVMMYNGLDLEIGYLPLLIESSRNAKIQPGRPGNFDCSRFVRVIEKNQNVDRSMGDVHSLGNPHYHFSPSNILRVARGMAQELAGLDSGNVSFYRANLAAFENRLQEKQRQWSRIALAGKRFVSYHKLFEYMADEFGFRIIAYIEPKPGIPPSAGHIEKLVDDLKRSRPDGILATSSQGRKEAESLAQKTGIKVILLPQDVGALPGTGDWFGFMDFILSALQQ